MSSLDEHHDHLAEFQALFRSYSRAHGTFQITKAIAETGKKKGNSRKVEVRVTKTGCRKRKGKKAAW